jgi:hypothetical protein
VRATKHERSAVHRTGGVGYVVPFDAPDFSVQARQVSPRVPKPLNKASSGAIPFLEPFGKHPRPALCRVTGYLAPSTQFGGLFGTPDYLERIADLGDNQRHGGFRKHLCRYRVKEEQ